MSECPCSAKSSSKIASVLWLKFSKLLDHFASVCNKHVFLKDILVVEELKFFKITVSQVHVAVAIVTCCHKAVLLGYNYDYE